MYDFKDMVPEEMAQQVNNLDKDWTELILKSEQTDFNMESYKKGFIEHT
jgi:hypothetical protein